MFTDKKITRYLFLLPVLLAYLPVLMSHQHVDPDAKIILGNLYGAAGISGYLNNLFSFKTVDFQPLRDLTLSFDIWSFYKLGINTFITQNLLWWMASLIIFRRIICFLFPRISDLTLSLLISCLGVYPLYSGVISWGMNRKHLLALFFITLATDLLLRSRKPVLIVLCFILSTLSQPIHILWPLWASAYILHTKNFRNNLKLISGLFISLIAVAVLNTLYYSQSETYKFFFTDKTADLWNIPDKTLALGHYLFQLFAPYILSFKYDLSHWSVLTGIILLPVALYLCYKEKNRRELLLWAIAGFLPVLVVLNDPHVISDAYLLYPGFALFIITLHIFNNHDFRISRYWLIAPLLIWGILTARNSSLWNNRLDLAGESFRARPSCESVMNYLKVGYDLYERDPEALKFAETHSCFKEMTVTSSFYYSLLVLFSHYYFHEEALPLEFRLERLTKLSERHLYAHLSLIALLLKEKNPELAKAEVERLEMKWGRMPVDIEYHEITARFVRPFCESENLSGCLLITEKLIRKPDRPNL